MGCGNNNLDYFATTPGKIKPFKFWCQKVLPLVYDDSLSYYELLCKVVAMLNEVIKGHNDLIENITELTGEFNELQQQFVQLQNLFNQLKEYVDNYFNNLDVQQEINNKLDEMVKNGQLDNILSVEASLVVNQLNNFYDNEVARCLQIRRWSHLDDAISKNQALRIAIVGDSISVGANQYRPYFDYFADIIQGSFITANFFNFCIGGRNFSQFAGDYITPDPEHQPWWTDITKTWKEIVMQWQPDVLIVAFGMNDAGGIDAIPKWVDNMLLVQKYWENQADIVYVTSMTPHFQQQYDGKREAFIVNGIAECLRNIGTNYYYNLVDVNALWNVLALGQTVNNNNPVQYDGVESISNMSCANIDFNIALSSWGTLAEKCDLFIRDNSDFAAGYGKIALRFYQDDRSTRHIALIYINADGSDGLTYFTWNLSGLPTDSINVKVNDYVYTIQGVDFTFYFLAWDGNASISDALKNHIAGFNFVDLGYLSNPYWYKPELMWGIYRPEDPNSFTEGGGNGVNHPSNFGVKMTYQVAFNKLACEIQNRYAVKKKYPVAYVAHPIFSLVSDKFIMSTAVPIQDGFTNTSLMSITFDSGTEQVMLSAEQLAKVQIINENNAVYFFWDIATTDMPDINGNFTTINFNRDFAK